LAVGGGSTVEFAVTVADPLAAGVTQLVNAVSIADDGTSGSDPTPGNNSDTDATPVGNPSSVSGYAYFDGNNNSVFDADELPLPNATVTLTGTDVFGTPVYQVTTTDAQGYYAFGPLFAGDYRILQSQPYAYVDGKDAIGTQGGWTGNDEFLIALPGGYAGVGNNFGERRLRDDLAGKASFVWGIGWGEDSLEYDGSANPPGMGLSNARVAEGLPIGTVVGALSTDYEGVSGPFSYSLVAGAGSSGNALFRISGNQLLTNAVFDFGSESSYGVRIRSAGADDAWVEGPFLVTITNVAPTADAGRYYDDDIDTIIVLNGAASSDPGNGIVLYEWDLDNDGQYDDATGVTANFDATVKGSYSVGLRVTDDGGASGAATATVVVDNDTIALFDPTHAVYYLRNHNAAGPANWAFDYGSPALGWTTTLGDWNGDGIDTVGLYDPAGAVYYLRNVNAAGSADIAFAYGLPGSGWQPVVGDWNADGTTTVGLFDPVGSVFYLRNSHAAGYADHAFPYGAPGAGWQPVIGDWDGDGDETVGLYDAENSVFYLRNGHGAGVSDVAFSYGPPGRGWQPVVGDWDADGIDTVGLYDATSGVFYLRNSHAPGVADRAFQYGPPGRGWRPAIGDWDDTGAALHAPDSQVYGSAGPTTLRAADLQPIVAQAVADWVSAGFDVDLFNSLDFAIADLPGSQLGLARAGKILLDIDGAGHGWFVDPTPADDEEFRAVENRLEALDPAAVDRIDLLTVVSHEIGHTLGLSDLDATIDGLMSELLEPGMRREPGIAEIDAAISRL
jgi:hypothetical protein